MEAIQCLSDFCISPYMIEKIILKFCIDNKFPVIYNDISREKNRTLNGGEAFWKKIQQKKTKWALCQ